MKLRRFDFLENLVIMDNDEDKRIVGGKNRVKGVIIDKERR